MLEMYTGVLVCESSKDASACTLTSSMLRESSSYETTMYLLTPSSRDDLVYVDAEKAVKQHDSVLRLGSARGGGISLHKQDKVRGEQWLRAPSSELTYSKHH